MTQPDPGPPLPPNLHDRQMSLDDLTNSMSALAVPTRTQLMGLLIQHGCLTVSNASSLLGISHQLCSAHLNVLRASHLVSRTKSGSNSIYYPVQSQCLLVCKHLTNLLMSGVLYHANTSTAQEGTTEDHSLRPSGGREVEPSDDSREEDPDRDD